jgi:hypothetical protein
MFFQGALKTWERFTQDICDDPEVTGAMPEQHQFTFRHPANDLNEGSWTPLLIKVRSTEIGSQDQQETVRATPPNQFSEAVALEQ